MAGVVLCDIAACFIKVILRDRRNIFARLLEFYGQIEWQAWENREGVILRGRGSIWCRCRHSLWETLRFTLYTPNSTLYITLHFTLYTLHFRLFPTSLCGVLVFGSALPPRPLPPPAHNLSTHDLSTHNLSTHNLLTHNLLTHNLLTHKLPTHNLLTHNLSTHNLLTHTTCQHTTYSHNLLNTQLTHTQLVHTQLTPTQLTQHTTCPPHNLLNTQLPHTHNLPPHTHTHLRGRTCSLGDNWITHNCVAARGNLLDMDVQLVHTPGTPGTYGTGMALVASLVPS